MDPKYSGPSITAQNSDVHTTTDFEPGAAEVLSSEMTHEMSQIGVPHSTHAAFNSVCEGWTQKLTKISIVVKYIVVAAWGQHTTWKIGWITLKMKDCLDVCLRLGKNPMSWALLTLARQLQRMLVMTSLCVFAGMGRAQTVQTLTNFRLITSVKTIFVNYV